MSDYLSTKALAALVPHTSDETWQRLCRTKQVPAKKVGRGWVVRRVDFEAFMADGGKVAARPNRPGRSARQMRRSA